MDIAGKVLQLKQDFDNVYKAGQESGGGNGGYEQGYEDGKNSVVDLARNAKVFQMGSTEGLPEEITFNFDYMTSFTDFWRAVVNKTVKRVTLNINTKPTVLTRLFSQNQVSDYNRAIEHITINADTSSVTHFNQMLYSMTKLKIVDGSPIDFSSATTIGTWCDASVLEEIRVVKESIKISISVPLPSASDETVQSFVDGLADLTGGTTQTLTVHKNIGEKLTDEQKATITAKNWTLAY